jgi:hypothetical protein
VRAQQGEFLDFVLDLNRVFRAVCRS